MTQLSEAQLAIIRDHPIGDALDLFRAAFGSAHPRTSLRGDLDHYQQLVAQPARKLLVLQLINTFQTHPTAFNLLSDDEQGPLLRDLAMLYVRLSTNQTDVKHTARLVKSVVSVDTDSSIWAAVYNLIHQTQPPLPTFAVPTISASAARPITPQPTPPTPFNDTPWVYKTSSIVTSTTETREDVDPLLEFEVEQNLIVDHPRFFDTFFGRVAELHEMATAVFDVCTKSATPMYASDGVSWTDWPADSNQDGVLAFLRHCAEQFVAFAVTRGFAPPPQERWCHSTPTKACHGSIAKHKPDFSIVSRKPDGENIPNNWAHVLIPGELKSERDKDGHKDTRMQISRYAREVFAAQDARRFVLGFTLCGSIMRLWEFDRLGVLASESFDINAEGHRFVSVILGYLWMSEEDLGFDPTIHKDEHGRYIEVERGGEVECIDIEPMVRPRSIAGRGTTCWKGYVRGGTGEALLIKDSWQLEEHSGEGPLLKKAAEAKVENVARYYHHETVRIGATVDDVRECVRRGLDAAEGRRPNRRLRLTASGVVMPRTSGRGTGESGSKSVGAGRGGSKSRTEAGSRKRSLSTVEESNPSPPPKRSCSDLASQKEGPLPNRIHHRTITRDVGESLFKASSLQVMLTGLLGGLKGHESLFKAGTLHRDISIGNVLLYKNDGLLIDLDLAVDVDRQNTSGATSKTGTKVFMAIGALYGDPHLSVHDKESFFWLLFWICAHWNGRSRPLSGCRYDNWNWKNTEELAEIKAGKVLQEERFNKEVRVTFTEYCRPLIPCIQELRKVVFPGGMCRTTEDDTLHSRMKMVLERAIGTKLGSANS